MERQNPVLTAIRERRSVRRYTGDPVTREELLRILEAGRWAPSGLNNQPWRFLVIQAGDTRQEALASCSKYAPILRSASALICVFLDREAMYHEAKDHQSAGACIQNMLLAAHALDLGGVWLGEIINHSPQVMDALSLDSRLLELQAVIALGRPAHPGVSSRKELAELLLEEL
ncbi:nitroreductase family protein [Desulfocurvibacter africanus]|uniref:Nitroreductase n=1 Tax=Desulfocurvibacter africanus subsp. africanus str. Walvis Bay TaxID=690850 RepID=F3Z359_DESAF|nr:nitroreductase family protein [Desulfocurvibacter africanus]EGJ50303.1 nitroreductase [Desulfocurvibacter africanus subsp. africanus str. Walvis Bay]